LNFCKGWDLIIKLGLVDDSFQMDLNENESLFSFYSRFYPFQTIETAKDDFIRFLGNNANADLIKKIEFLGFFDQDTKVPVSKGSPAFIFQKILEEKWALEETDTDFVVMAHFFEFLIENKKVRLISYFTKEGQDNYFTAMSELVGMPIAFATQLIIEGQMKQRGVLLPFTKEIYQPILTKLEEQGIHFIEEEIIL
jgi:saccharopine dehydrogenase (NADP+, L-glutamate forming)